ncbi:hypothetical protein CC80DRAFT_152108 [Byssothecium circinans]|uniref:Uncharacterized protein n=1 Tax=Byssothecium circinans TaxID=147558 RepID=A0A6A5TR15_9PLEO|nr:hypothetical protein CC80DRAFT_152108 [Byssothecium circinans]
MKMSTDQDNVCAEQRLERKLANHGVGISSDEYPIAFRFLSGESVLSSVMIFSSRKHHAVGYICGKHLPVVSKRQILTSYINPASTMELQSHENDHHDGMHQTYSSDQHKRPMWGDLHMNKSIKEIAKKKCESLENLPPYRAGRRYQPRFFPTSTTNNPRHKSDIPKD